MINLGILNQIDNSARYWRILFTGRENTLTQVGLSEIRFYSGVWDSTHVSVGGTGAVSVGNGTKLFNGVTQENAWEFNTVLPEWASYDFGSAVDIKQYKLYIPSSDRDRFTDWTLQNSHNNTTWKDIHEVSGFTNWPVNFTYAVGRTFTVPNNTNGHRYWRLLFIAQQEPLDRYGLFEVRLFSEVSGANQAGLGIANSLNSQATLPSYRAFDLQEGSQWRSLDDNPVNWLSYDFGENNNIDILKYSIKTETPGGSLESWKFQYSDDDAVWVDVHTKTSEPAWSSGEERTYNV